MDDIVGYLGPETTFGHIAAESYFGRRKKLGPYLTHASICEAVGKDEARYGVVAIESSIDGVVSETIRAVDQTCRKRGLHVIGEVEVPIELFYLKKNNDGRNPEKVISHPTALGQCSQFINQLLKDGIPAEARSSTGTAAEEASKNPALAAIASKKAETLYGLQRLQKESVVDNKNAVTRFWILGKEAKKSSGKDKKDKTALLINLEQAVPGGLVKSLGFFAEKSINLLVIYPISIRGRKWEYTFFVEFAGHADDEPMKEALNEFSESGISLGGPLVLGSYPAAI